MRPDFENNSLELDGRRGGHALNGRPANCGWAAVTRAGSPLLQSFNILNTLLTIHFPCSAAGPNPLPPSSSTLPPPKPPQPTRPFASTTPMTSTTLSSECREARSSTR